MNRAVTTRHRRRIALTLTAAAAVAAGTAVMGPARADSKVGINVLLKGEATEAALAGLAQHGAVLDVIPQIRAVTLRAEPEELAAIQSLSYVAAAALDAELEDAGTD